MALLINAISLIRRIFLLPTNVDRRNFYGLLLVLPECDIRQYFMTWIGNLGWQVVEMLAGGEQYIKVICKPICKLVVIVTQLRQIKT